MRFSVSLILVVCIYEFAYTEQNICTEEIESIVVPRILKRSLFRPIDPWYPYLRRYPHPSWYPHHLRLHDDYDFEPIIMHPHPRRIYDDYDFDEPIMTPIHHFYSLNPEQLITCGTITNISLPLTFPEKLSMCDYCNKITLELKQLNGELVPESAFPDLQSVTDIHLDNLGIKYLSPGAFDDMENLKEIHLSNNKISQISAGVFNNIEKLTAVDLSHNNIRDIVNNMLYKKKINPLSLNLSHNDIDYLGTELFQTVLFNLSSLDLSYNKILTFDTRYITSDILKIDLSHNSLFTIHGCIYNIHKLILSHNSIKSLENECSDTSFSMKYLDLSHNKLTEINFETFPLYLGIETLLLQSNSITNISIGAFSQMVHLQKLNLSYNRIPSLPRGSSENLDSLKILDLSNNLLKRLDFNTLHSLPSLTDLYIQNNMVVDFKYEELLKAFPKLRSINIDNNNFTCDNLMETVFYLETKAVGIVYGTKKYEENILGMACHTERRKFYQEHDEKKTDQSDTVKFVEYTASYYKQIGMFWITIMVLVLLLLILAFQTFFLHYKCNFRQLENVEMI